VLATDSDGALLDGAHRYALHLETGQFPDAGAFWSLTAYDSQGMPVPNPVNRHALGSRDPLRYNADGSLDLVFSHPAPPPENQSNWLPIPAAGPVGMLLRVYLPGPAVRDGLWTPPAVRRDVPEAEVAEASNPAVEPETAAQTEVPTTAAAPAAPPAKKP